MNITYQQITQATKAALRMPNEPFDRFGQFVVTRDTAGWQHHEVLAPAVTQQTFPDEDYQLATISANGFAIGAFAGAQCVGLAIYEYNWRHYVYLADLKVTAAMRRQGVGRGLLDAARPVAQAHGSLGMTTIAQGSNLAANRFYLKYGFVIGGYNTLDYEFTTQRGDTDVYYYLRF